MEINATFFVQIINFWITYWLLSKILFKPFITHIYQKESSSQALFKRVQVKENKLALLQEEKQHQLVDFKHYIHTHYVLPKTTIEVEQQPLAYDFQPEQIELLTRKIKNVLVKAAQHDH